MPVLVGIFTAQMLHDVHLADIGAQRKQSTPTGAADAEICRNALATPQVSNQRSADATDPNDSAPQGECERHSGRRPVRAGMRMVHSTTCEIDTDVGLFLNVSQPLGR